MCTFQNHNICSFDSNNDFDIIDATVETLNCNISKSTYFDPLYLPATKLNSLFLIHFNTRSLQKNFDKFHEFLCSLSVTPDIICISESRLKGNPITNITLPGYDFIHNDSPTSAGGVAVYIANNISYNLLTNLKIEVDNCENIWIELTSYKLIIGTIYRHPKNILQTFMEGLNKNMEVLKNKKVFLIGDMNINLSHPYQQTATDYLNLLHSNGYIPIITTPTRVTDNSSTIIDHIITNDYVHSLSPGVIKSDLTDHFPIFCNISKIANMRKSPQSSYQREFSNFKVDKFCYDINNAATTLLQNNLDMNCLNFNNIFTEFLNKFEIIVEKHAPFKKLSRRQRKLSLKPWITPGLLKSIKKKQLLYKSHFINGNSIQKCYYKKYSNKLTRLKFMSKQLYFKDQFEKSKTNPFRSWQLIKSLLPSSKDQCSLPERLKYNNENVTDVNTIVEVLNDHFCNIGKNLANKIAESNPAKRLFHKYLEKKNISSLFLSPTTPHEVFDTISSLKNSKALGYDKIATYFVKVAAKELAWPLSMLFNYSFSYGIFPDCLKIAKIIPVFKNGDKSEINNYRPISILSPFSKILEKLIYARTIEFCNKHSIIIPTQYGFRAKHCTSHALLDVTTTAFDNIQQNKYTALLFLDLKKAFDTVNHQILLEKLHYIGIRGVALSLFSSFLHKRFQFVSAGNIQSTFKKVDCGVPQGSILGPLLFTIYINDIINSTLFCPRLFADDTCLILQDNNIHDLQKKINLEITAVNDWMRTNLLTVNFSKSSIMILSPKSGSDSINPLLHNKVLSSHSIPYTKSAKYLGITIDTSLSFKLHTDSLISKLSRSVGILFKLKPFLTTPALLSLYYAIFHSHIQYAIFIWGSTYKSYSIKITSLQNKAIKIIGGGTWFDNATPFYKKFKILKFKDLFKLETALFIYKFKANLLPSTFTNYFYQVKNKYKISTRGSNSSNYFIPYYQTTKLQRSIKYHGPKLWNSLDTTIKNSKSANIFKKRLKNSLLNNYS